jgi:3-phosphoshikimate 1-carboxyvinyltransferase
MLKLFPPENINCTIKIGGSKSISNRLLMLREILKLDIEFENLSESEDTRVLQNALRNIREKVSEIDIGHAGTDMRFLTAYLSTVSGEWILTGSERMKQRPIGILVSALKSIGAEIYYVENEGFPPLKIIGKNLDGGKVMMDGSVSSQFISALLLVSPKFSKGLEVEVIGKIVSQPYLEMTKRLIEEFRMKVTSKSSASDNNMKRYDVESDWSSASYWFSICALCKNSSIRLKSFFKESLQADSVLPKIYNDLGVHTRFINHELILSQKHNCVNKFVYDFSDCPDIALTVAVTCCALKVDFEFSGLETLKLKESDRVKVLILELKKCGEFNYEISSDGLKIENFRLGVEHETVAIATHNDHRMAMAFAPLSILILGLVIQHPEVVTKSYPKFWEDLKAAGFSVNLLS